MAATSLGQGLVSASEADERGMGSDDEKGAYSIPLAVVYAAKAKNEKQREVPVGDQLDERQMTG
jgi:hypothetical protein